MNLESVSVAELREFVERVIRLRAAQRIYFTTRDKGTLAKCKSLEHIIDGHIETMLGSPPRLFDPQGEGGEL